jgi:hypothetical protein
MSKRSGKKKKRPEVARIAVVSTNPERELARYRIHAPELYSTVRTLFIMGGLVLMVKFGAGQATSININIQMAIGLGVSLAGIGYGYYERKTRKKYQDLLEKMEAKDTDT